MAKPETCRSCRGRGYIIVLGYHFTCPKKQRYFINKKGEMDSEFVPDATVGISALALVYAGI